MYYMQRLCPGRGNDTSQTLHKLFFSVHDPTIGFSDILVPADKILYFACAQELEAWYATQPDINELEKARGNKVFNYEQTSIHKRIGRPMREMIFRPISAEMPERRDLDRADRSGSSELAKVLLKDGIFADDSFLGVGVASLTHYQIVAPNPEEHWVKRGSKGTRPPRTKRVCPTNVGGLVAPTLTPTRAERARRRAENRERFG